MSRRDPRNLARRRLIICCTDRGQHERVTLGAIDHGSWGAEVAGSSAEDRWSRFTCPRCGRDVPMRKDTLGKAMVKLIEADVTHMDISYADLLT